MAASALAVCDGEEGDDAAPVPVVVDLLQAASARTAAAPSAPAASQWRPLRCMSCGVCIASPLRTTLVSRPCSTAGGGGGGGQRVRLGGRDGGGGRAGWRGLLS